jgi:hypothetical protein
VFDTFAGLADAYGDEDERPWPPDGRPDIR